MSIRKFRSTTRSIFPVRVGFVPVHLFDGSLRDFLGDRVVMGAQVVLQEVLMALGAASRALPRQMNQTRGQFSGASGSSTENRSSSVFQLRDHPRG